MRRLNWTEFFQGLKRIEAGVGGLEGGETIHPEGGGPFQKGDWQYFGGRLPELLPVHNERMGQDQSSPEDLFSNQFQGNLE